MAKKSISGEIAEKVNSPKKVNSTFDLNKFKQGKHLGAANSNYKPQEWIEFTDSVKEVLMIPGTPKGHTTLIRGRSNTGKTTLLIEQAIQAQKDGILPVIIITEMKHSWEHWETMGFNLEKTPTTDGGFEYNGFFIYVDSERLKCIEDVAEFIMDMLNEQKKGNLPYDLLFLWDSIGSIPSRMSLEKSSNNPMWNAGALSQQFANFVNQQIVLSRKENYPYTNTAIYINKIWVEPALTPMSQPKMKNKNGDSMYYDCSMAITFGNVTSDGTQKLNATKDKKVIEWGLKTKVQVDKNHVTGTVGKGTIISTAHGFIKDTPTSIDKYKKEHKHEWGQILGTEDFDFVEENVEENEIDFINE
jgi:hypothetical protein